MTQYADAVEGSLALCGIDLADYYRGEMTMRALWVRIQALPAEAWLWRELRAEAERAEEAQVSRDIDEAVAMMRRGR